MLSLAVPANRTPVLHLFHDSTDKYDSRYAQNSQKFQEALASRFFSLRTNSITFSHSFLSNIPRGWRIPAHNIAIFSRARKPLTVTCRCRQHLNFMFWTNHFLWLPETQDNETPIYFQLGSERIPYNSASPSRQRLRAAFKSALS